MPSAYTRTRVTDGTTTKEDNRHADVKIRYTRRVTFGRALLTELRPDSMIDTFDAYVGAFGIGASTRGV
ncbi:hypothetical protein DPMN_065630 [Dreissena polymorpha]|uniref:Uncharacterized protein n=1 Tax=Dreissena polymorpha TaxID=45954 RepID=A0A9D3YS00_DREPO|nr:hypothetical protein DPMN_065630 [Dreissena polymorpha]